MSDKAKPSLIVALDVDTLAEARELIDTLTPCVDIFKVGSRLFTACGPTAVRFVIARGKKVFLDLKYHDIPNTVASAVKVAVGLGESVHTVLDEDKKPVRLSDQGVFMLTVHLAGGREMCHKAFSAAREAADQRQLIRPFLVGITVLTSEKKDDTIQSLVRERALLAKECGLDGVVASVDEAPLIRRELGQDFIIVTPGIRPLGADSSDQKRVATPRVAFEAGSNFLVVGRPIIEASDPLEAARKILEEIQ